MSSSTGKQQTSSAACSHQGNTDLRKGSAAFEREIAVHELNKKDDLRHGVKHLAEFLALNPTNPEALELVQSYFAAVENFESVLPDQKTEAYYATEALRSFYWMTKGRLLDAANLLFSVANAKPDSQFLLHWGLDWFEPAGVIESLPEPLAWQIFIVILKGVEGPGNLTVEEVELMKRWSELAERYAAHSNKRANSSLMVRVGLLRRADLHLRAEGVVKAIINPNDHEAWLCLGLIYKDQAKLKEAFKAFEHVQKLAAKGDFSGWLESGDMYMFHEDWKAALICYERVIKLDPQNEWALPCARYCAWKIGNNEKHFNGLLDLAQKGNARARFLYLMQAGDLMEPLEASCDTLRQLRELVARDPDKLKGDIKMTLTCMESPSNLTAFDLEMKAHKQQAVLIIEPPPVPNPDPRIPIEDVKYTIWKYDGTDASPALEPPGDDVVNLIAKLAADRKATLEKWGEASRLAKQFGVARVTELLACLTYPPPLPKRMPAVTWLPRVQLLVGMVIANLDKGWEGSVRKDALLSMLYGPRDWITLAAIRTLTKVAQSERLYAADVYESFEKLSKCAPDFGDCVWELCLYDNWRTIPGITQEERNEFNKRVQEYQRA